jgi:hypothetical protein
MPTDLVLLVADKNIEHGLRGLLGRPLALGIRPVGSKIYVHPQRDPAPAQKPHELLRQFSSDYDKALVVFDHKGCGRENRSATQLEEDVRQLLSVNGWDSRGDAIVIVPELEAWVFATSSQVETCLTWSGPISLRKWLEAEGLWSPQHVKPADPKTALERALVKLRRPRSSAIYEDLARSVGFAQCQDLAFNRFKTVLQRWFPPIGGNVT